MHLKLVSSFFEDCYIEVPHGKPRGTFVNIESGYYDLNHSGLLDKTIPVFTSLTVIVTFMESEFITPSLAINDTI